MGTVQEMEQSADFRVKFAAIINGSYVPDAHEEYDDIFHDIPVSWTCAKAGNIQTRRDGIRQSWLLESDKVSLGAVEHETGLEILALNVASGIVTAGIIGLTTFLWKKWNTLRTKKPNKVTTSLECEYETRLSYGSARKVRISYSGPLDEQQAREILIAATSKADKVPDYKESA